MDKNIKTFRIRSAALIVSCLVLIVLLGAIDYITGEELSFSIFYLIPILTIAWKTGRTAGIFMSLAGTVTWFISDYSGSHYSHLLIPYWNAFVRLGFFVTASYILSRLKVELDKEKELARIDLLTGVKNSRSFFELAQAEIERSRRHGHVFSVAYLDLDNFKAINDTNGHSVGDGLLQEVAEVMKGSLRRIDLTARLGGDEFVALLPETDETTASLAIERMRQNLIESMEANTWPVTFSIGVVTFATLPQSVNDMIKEADSLMYLAKEKGKNKTLHKKI